MEVIKLGGRYFVWDAETVRTLHVKHRIVGCLVGSLPTSKNEQNIAHGLPLLLSPEEVAVGTKHGFISVIDGQSGYSCPSSELVAQHKNARQQLLEQGKQPACVVIPTTDVLVMPNQNVRINEIRPSTSRESLRYKIFADLWEKGFYVVVDNNVQVDFIVYRDSPMTVHAEFAVLVMEQDTPISALTMVRLSRLAKSLKKNLVLASANDTEIQYITVRWEGIT